MCDNEKAIKEESKNVRFLRMLVDMHLQIIAGGKLDRAEALEIIEKLRKICIGLFPDKGNTFDIIYRPRFLRLIDEVYGKQLWISWSGQRSEFCAVE